MLAREKGNAITKSGTQFDHVCMNKRSYLTNKLEYRHNAKIFEFLMC